MVETSRLIADIVASERKAARAGDALVTQGMPAVPDIIAALREQKDAAAWRLATVLLQFEDPHMVPVFVGLLDDENRDLVRIALRGLARLQDPAAVQPLVDYLLDEDNGLTLRGLAAEALGELGDPAAAATLRRVRDDVLADPAVAAATRGEPIPEDGDLDESTLLFVLSLALGLARLGEHEMAAAVMALLRYTGNDPYSDDQVIRTRAARVLQTLAGPGLFSALQQAAHDDYDEVRGEAIDALFYLGIKESVPELIDRVDDDNPELAELARIRIADLTGRDVETDSSADDLLAWWKQQQDAYESHVCYRLGKPIHLPDVIALLASPRWRRQVARELHIITGQNFGFNPEWPQEKQAGLRERAEAWWEQTRANYEDGHLYKYGHEQALAGLI